MNESRHTNSHQGICIYSFSVHNTARNRSRKGRNEGKRLKVSFALFIGGFGLPVLTHTQALNELPAAPCVLGARLKGNVINARDLAVWREGSAQIKHFLTSNPSTEIFSECGADGSRRQSISSCSVPAAQGIVLAQGRARPGSLSQAAGAGSQLSAHTDHPVYLNLSWLYPTYTVRLICSHLNADVVNVTLTHGLDPFVACGEE